MCASYWLALRCCYGGVYHLDLQTALCLATACALGVLLLRASICSLEQSSARCLSYQHTLRVLHTMPCPRCWLSRRLQPVSLNAAVLAASFAMQLVKVCSGSPERLLDCPIRVLCSDLRTLWTQHVTSARLQMQGAAGIHHSCVQGCCAGRPLSCAAPGGTWQQAQSWDTHADFVQGVPGQA